MIYILRGQEEYLVRQKINELTSIEDAHIIRFDGSEKDFSIDQMLEACTSTSLFSSKNIVLVNQPFFLTKRIPDEELADLYDYVSKPLYETDLIFYTLTDNLNSRLKAYKTIAQNAEVIDYKSYDYNNFNSYLRTRITEENLDISQDAITVLGNICKRNITLLNRNIELLTLYPEKITADVVLKLCTASDENDVFEMINAITRKDVSETIRIERKMLNETDSVLGVISLLANQLRYLYQVAYYQKIGKKRHEIAELTDSSDYRLNKAFQSLQKLNNSQILELLNSLCVLDMQCKSDSSISNNARLELFILDLLKKGYHAGNQTAI
ncbi:MAG: DNA polymerase III subunit delta [Erysipelotrichaceae bacterium]|nr:DNA polymerase III subunit delta [Erysipelotrichaceae bacterium]